MDRRNPILQTERERKYHPTFSRSDKATSWRNSPRTPLSPANNKNYSRQLKIKANNENRTKSALAGGNSKGVYNCNSQVFPSKTSGIDYNNQQLYPKNNNPYPVYPQQRYAYHPVTAHPQVFNMENLPQVSNGFYNNPTRGPIVGRNNNNAAEFTHLQSPPGLAPYASLSNRTIQNYAQIDPLTTLPLFGNESFASMEDVFNDNNTQFQTTMSANIWGINGSTMQDKTKNANINNDIPLFSDEFKEQSNINPFKQENIQRLLNHDFEGVEREQTKDIIFNDMEQDYYDTNTIKFEDTGASNFEHHFDNSCFLFTDQKTLKQDYKATELPFVDRKFNPFLQETAPLAWSKVVSGEAKINKPPNSSDLSTSTDDLTFTSLMSITYENKDINLYSPQSKTRYLSSSALRALFNNNTTANNPNHIGNTPKYITDSLSYIAAHMRPIGDTDQVTLSQYTSSSNSKPSLTRPYSVVKVVNLPWTVSSSEIISSFSRSRSIRIPTQEKLVQCVHIMMDCKTGKTRGVAYVEVIVDDPSELGELLKNIRYQPVQGRRVKFLPSSYDALCNEIFNEWQGKFVNGVAVKSTNTSPTDTTDTTDTMVTTVTTPKSMLIASAYKPNEVGCNNAENDPLLLCFDKLSLTVSDRGGNSPMFIGQRELQQLLNICRNYKIHYNRKCPDRCFEYLISLVMNIPWEQPKTVTTHQRDIVYECYKLATGALRNYTDKLVHSFSSEILGRLVTAAVVCEGFTVKQKNGILNNANMICPKHLQYHLKEPNILNDPVLSLVAR